MALGASFRAWTRSYWISRRAAMIFPPAPSSFVFSKSRADGASFFAALVKPRKEARGLSVAFVAARGSSSFLGPAWGKSWSDVAPISSKTWAGKG